MRIPLDRASALLLWGTTVASIAPSLDTSQPCQAPAGDPEAYLVGTDSKGFQYHQNAELVGRADARNTDGFASEIRRFLNLLAGNKGVHILIKKTRHYN